MASFCHTGGDYEPCHHRTGMGNRAWRFIKAELKRAEVTYEELAKRLEGHGLKETESSIANKLRCGTLSKTLFLKTLAALGLEGMRLEDL